MKTRMKSENLTLYIYQHCPYCIRVLVFAKINNINLNITVLANDDEQTPISMVGVKSLPILETSKEVFIKESLDIIAYLDKKYNKRQLQDYNLQNEEISNWIINNKLDIYSLSMPRWVNMPLEEFVTNSAKAYFTEKKENYIGSFKKALETTNIYCENIENNWQELEVILLSDEFKLANKIDKNIDSIILFSILYGLTHIPELNWSQPIKEFMSSITKRNKIKLY